MQKPTNANCNLDRRTSTLFFPDQTYGEYSMRGGICWPMQVDSGGVIDVQGYAIMAGQDVKTKIVYVFEQKSFIVVDNIVNPDHTIGLEGIASWFNKCWSQYYALDFFYHQKFEHQKKFRLDVIRSQVITPKPQFIEVPWAEDGEVQSILWHFVKLGTVKIDRDTQLMEKLELTKRGDKQIWPAVHALQCCLAGIVRSPWREPR